MIRQIRDFWLQFDQTPVKLLSRLKNMGGMWIWEDLPVGKPNVGGRSHFWHKPDFDFA